MRNTNKLLVSAGAVALILSGSVVAAPPIAFDQWSATGGNISINAGACPTNWTCVPMMAGDGFLQVQLTNKATNESYFQTLITNPGATGTPSALPFADENFVKLGAAGGISGKQNILDNTTNPGTVFTSGTELQTGWAAPAAGQNLVILTQGLTESAAGFSSPFRLEQTSDNLGVVLGKKMDINQSVSLGGTDKQVFALRERAGSYVTSSGTLSLPGQTNVAYAAGDDIKTTVIGQQLTLGFGTGTQNFGFQSYDNVTKQQATPPVTPNRNQVFSLAADLSATGWPFTWNTVFDPKPTF
ncbi:MAG: hypothetical protein ACOY4D_04035 [Pseudomonadota bacterium]